MLHDRMPRLLIADDEPDHIQLLRAHLHASDVRIEEALDGNVAIAKYLVAQAIGDPYDLVVLDGVMPGKNGFQVAEEIRLGDKETMIAFLTGDHSGVAPMRASLIDAVAFWRKPLVGPSAPEVIAREVVDLLYNGLRQAQ